MYFRVLHMIFGFLRKSEERPLAPRAGLEPATQ